ncbi:DUF1769-domain-containing protein [Exidia glandulosa HHB12029]|uniref:DUF1769-domain-containing protein n=1 Tax=Exidia glandulosa HHB12029 TaxID=1314781 RepID=A0A166AAE1_EXIGL|nr:DUF1769-domain-containing protein [Exidia glandulosa HHB12029]
MPKLRVLAGPSTRSGDLKPISINNGSSHNIKNDAFEGRVSVFLRYEDSEDVTARRNEYFEHPARRGVTWSIQVQGRFLGERNADTVLFGNTFDRPLKLPWGTNAVLSFMKYVDPTLEQDLAGAKPWALSPLVCTMPYLRHDYVDASSSPDSWPVFPAAEPLAATNTELESPYNQEPAKRRQHFTPAVLQNTTLGPTDLLTSDFCYGFLSFPSLTLKLPGGISFDCKRYWDGQPVRFVCCERTGEGGSIGPGRVFWCVSFELGEEDGDEDGDDPTEEAEEQRGNGAVPAEPRSVNADTGTGNNGVADID